MWAAELEWGETFQYKELEHKHQHITTRHVYGLCLVIQQGSRGAEQKEAFVGILFQVLEWTRQKKR